MNSTQDAQEATPADPRLLNAVRLWQIREALVFLQYYHNPGWASDPLTRGRFVLFNVLEDSSRGWYASLRIETDEEYNPDLLGDQEFDDEHRFGKGIWINLRKSWVDGQSM
jgi:hypothetical protein